MRAWPRVTAFSLGMIPVVMLGFMVVTLVLQARPAITEVGWERLLGSDFSSQYTSGFGRYGLQPAVAGTVLVVFIAVGLALPVSLAMGIFASGLPTGIFGRGLRIILGVLSGIPPIVYALMSVVFVAPFISPKFTAGFTYSDVDPAKVGVDPADWPPAGVPWNAGAFPWDPTGQDNSTLLAGIMLSLLVIPFMAPLIDDAIRNVQREPKEASYALGATRWYTLRRIVLPRAMPGIIAATSLGALKALGDVMIVLFVVGFDARLPVPRFDVLERTAPLTSTGAALIGGVNSPASCRDIPPPPPVPTTPGQPVPPPAARPECAVGYFGGLVLLVMALTIVGITWALERWYRGRFAVG